MKERIKDFAAVAYITALVIGALGIAAYLDRGYSDVASFLWVITQTIGAIMGIITAVYLFIIACERCDEILGRKH